MVTVTALAAMALPWLLTRACMAPLHATSPAMRNTTRSPLATAAPEKLRLVGVPA